MSEKHTPGPWEFAADFDVNGEKARITTIAVCCDFVIGLPSQFPGGNYRDGDPSGEPEADARLIAAAPELLEASKIGLHYIEAVCFNATNPKKRENYARAASTIRAAIAKAIGEQK
jgi:hypothetical protein